MKFIYSVRFIHRATLTPMVIHDVHADGHAEARTKAREQAPADAWTYVDSWRTGLQ